VNIVVIGAGLIGVTSAYRLQRAGHAVTLIEREQQLASGASYANGGMLTPSMADPWNAPGVWKDLLRWMGKADAPMLLQPRALPSLSGWGLKFLAASSPPRFDANTWRNLHLAAYSVAGMRELRAEETLDYEASTLGTIKIYRNAAAFDAGLKKMRRYAHSAVDARPLSAAEVVSLEPGLTPIQSQLAGAVHFASDESGNARLFTEQLWAAARRRGAVLRHSQVTQIVVTKGRVRGVVTQHGTISTDVVVVAAGSDTPKLLRPLGVRVPIRPVKGYSLTCTPFDGTPPPLSIPIVDDDLHAAVTPLGASIRIAGTAEFVGFNREITPARIENLKRLLREVLPASAEKLLAADVQPWAGLRPVCADGVPCIGACGPEGLYVNSGHGHLGWTMADGSARLLTDLINGKTPAIEAKDYDPKRWR
jgi:D-amino-acid dehydrogenase